MLTPSLFLKKGNFSMQRRNTTLWRRYCHTVVLSWAIKHFDFQKLAGLWLAGKMLNHVGIFGSKVAIDFSSFQCQSCCILLCWPAEWGPAITWIQWSAIIAQSNITWFCIWYDNDWGKMYIRSYIHKNTPNMSHSGVSYGVSFVRIWVKINRFITALHCILFPYLAISTSISYNELSI